MSPVFWVGNVAPTYGPALACRHLLQKLDSLVRSPGFVKILLTSYEPWLSGDEDLLIEYLH